MTMLLKLMEMVARINKLNQLQRADNLADHDRSICASSLVLFCANGCSSARGHAAYPGARESETPGTRGGLSRSFF